MNQDESNPLSFTPRFHVFIRDGVWELHDSLRAGRASFFFNLAMDEARAITNEGQTVQLSPLQQLAADVDCPHNMDIFRDCAS